MRKADFGARLRSHRERAGKTRTVLGGLVGRSEEWVKAVENGRILQPRLPMLLRLAEVLGVTDLAELTGSGSMPVAALTKAASVPGDRVVAVMTSHARPSARTEPDVDRFLGRVDQAWQLWHTAPAGKAAIAAVLPDLLVEARATVAHLDGTARRRAGTGVARTYHLAQQLFAFSPHPEMVWLSADRAMAAAQDSDDPAAIAAAAWYYAHVYRSSGQLGMAHDVVVDATAELDPHSGEAEQLARWGKLQLAAARTHSKAGEEGLAWQCWDRAKRAADALPAGYMHPWLMFGAAEVAATAVGMEADLFHPGRAIRRSATLDLGGLPAHRRAAAYIDIARAYQLTGDPVGLVHMIGKALRENLDVTEREPFVRQALLDLVDNGGPVRDDARELALVVGLLR
ncbi:helix-turn-helix transcriptional regulator [Catellatospora sp. NPDC049609]|uniref:helix-turn-helix domain-containing protein n=1 Tax=Catellatospora sp. NPDC049609 TaxID=3155505 RepID=UPI00344635E8